MGVKFGWYYKMAYLCTRFPLSLVEDARMVESVDTRDLKSLGHCGCAGSSPASSTRCNRNHWKTDDCDFCFV